MMGRRGIFSLVLVMSGLAACASSVVRDPNSFWFTSDVSGLRLGVYNPTAFSADQVTQIVAETCVGESLREYAQDQSTGVEVFFSASCEVGSKNSSGTYHVNQVADGTLDVRFSVR